MNDKPIALPTSTAEHLGNLPDTKLNTLAGKPTDVTDYLETILEAGRMTMTNDVLSSAEELPDYLEWNNERYSSAGQTPSDASGKAVTGRAAIIRAQSRIGGGVPVPYMLPHSGFWGTYLPPGESDLLDLWRSMVNDKISLGRYTYGAIYSATSIVTVRRIVEFCLPRNEATSVDLTGDAGKTNSLLHLIKVTDIPFMFNGMGVAMYPRGIEYSSPCVADPRKCTHITTGTIMPATLAHYDSSRIPESIMPIITSQAANSVTVDNVKLYQATLSPTKKVTVVDETGVPTDLYYTVPSLATAIQVGELWIGEVHTAVINALGTEQPATDTDWSERNTQIARTAKTSFLCQYAAWVTKIDMYEGGMVTERNDINQILTVLSGSDSVRQQVVTTLEQYMKESSIGVVGVPSAPCPACGATPSSDVHIIAVDPVRLFFKCLLTRVTRINQRSLL